MKSYNIHQAKTHLSRLLEAVARGEEIIIAKAGKPIARLVPVTGLATPRTLGALCGAVKESPDCWDPDPELESLFYGEHRKKPGRVAERRRRR